MSNRTVYKDTDSWRVDLEEHEGRMYIHVLVKVWNRTVYNWLLDEFIILQQALKEMGYKKVYGWIPEETEDFALLFDWQISNVTKDGHVLVWKDIGE